MTAPRAATPQIVAMTAIRGIAAWWVVFYHFRIEMYPLTGPAVERFFSFGYVAVDLFFELSGFVICLNYASRFTAFSWGKYGRFMLLRIGRIYPLHFCMLMLMVLNPAAIVVFSHASILGERYDFTYFILSLFLVQNWGMTKAIAWNYPAWSISTELAAYLLFPVIVAVAAFCARRVWGMFGLVLVLCLGLAWFGARFGGLNSSITTFGLLRCILEFSIGVALASAYARGFRFTRFQANLASTVAVGLFVLFYFIRPADQFIFPAGFFLLLCCLTCPASLLSRVLSFRVLELVGLVSYSTYLAHAFVKDWVKFLFLRQDIPLAVTTAAYIVITAVASVALYRWVEVPGRDAFRTLTRKSSS